jgi:hypothetical protein
MNSDRRARTAALPSGVQRHCDVDVAMLRGFLRKVRGRRGMSGTGGEREEYDE